MRKLSAGKISAYIEKKAKTIGLCLFIVNLFIVFINNSYLNESPFKGGFSWEDVSYCAVNKDGVVGVIDSLSSRVSIVSSDKKLLGSINSSAILGRDLQAAEALAFSDDSVYILDLKLSDSGNTVRSQRILKYSLKGKKQGVFYETPQDAPFFLRDIYMKDGICYAAAMDETRTGEAIIGEIRNGQFYEIHRFITGGSEIFSISYNPEKDSTCIITYDGKLIIADGDTVRNQNPISEKAVPSRAVVNDYNYLVALDSNNDRLYIVDPDEKIRNIASTYASYVSEKDDYLVFADPIKEEVSRYNSDDASTLVLDGAEYTVKYRIGVIATYLCLILAVAYILALFLKLVISFVKALKSKSWDEKTELNSRDRITIKSMITTMMPTFVMCYIVAAFILATAIWSAEIEDARENLMDAAEMSMYITRETVGDRFCEISSEKDCNSEAYNEIIRMYEELSRKSSEDDRSYGYYLFRFLDDSQSVITISDALGQYRTGEIISLEEQAGLNLVEEFEAAREGKTRCNIYNYRNGMELLWATAPVMNSSGTIVGAAMFSINYSLLKTNIFSEITRSMERMLVLMAGFLFLLAEIMVGRSLARLQLDVIKKGNREHTLVESRHTIQVLSDVSKSISAVFFTLIAADIMNRSGTAGAVLLALPFTIQSLAAKAASLALIAIPLEKSKKAMAAGALLQITGAVVGIVAVLLSGYVFLCVSAAMLSFGAKVCTGRSSKISKMGTKVTDRYDDLESNGLIAPTIGTAIGSAFRTYFGNMAIFIILIVLSTTFILVMNLFINDVAVKTEKPEKIDAKADLIKMTCFVLRPKFLTWVAFILIPSVTMLLMSSYVLPLLTSSVKASDIFIAAITVLVAFITMYVMPYARKTLERLKPNVIFAIAMGILSLLFLVYAKVQSLECFAVIILAVSILTVSFTMSYRDILKREAELSSLQEVNREQIIGGVQSILFSIMPTALSLLLQRGTDVFGLVNAAFLMISSVISLRMFREPEKMFRTGSQ